MPQRARAKMVFFVLAGLLVGCAARIPKEALQLPPESLRERQVQTRRFETLDEKKLLTASAALLQDIGFIIEESETGLGVIVASKDRDATQAGQVVAAVLLALLTGVPAPIDAHQRMRAAVVTRPVGDDKSTAVRVTFQRIVWNTERRITKREDLKDPRIYQEFFAKLSKAVFLEAHEL